VAGRSRKERSGNSFLPSLLISAIQEDPFPLPRTLAKRVITITVATQNYLPGRALFLSRAERFPTKVTDGSPLRLACRPFRSSL
jgi:hypothetical protein